MKARSTSEEWVRSVRSYLSNQLNSNWQITQNKGKVMLGIRWADGDRTYKYLPFRWERTNHGKIQSFIEEVHDLVINKKVGLNEALERVKKTQSESLKAAKSGNKNRIDVRSPFVPPLLF
ncbi:MULTISPECIES: hypothetical protein [Prochlorococcus]|nr:MULTISPECIES: hypothetical protein [Prochlorococcus]